MIIKFTVNSEWAIWKNNLCETYGNKGWSTVKYAYTFKFQGGSLLEYATKKERLLLEINKEIDTQTMINLIVMGLPDYIIFKMDKGSIKSTANLYNEIGKLDKLNPCIICEKLNKGSRFHSEEKCWFKQTDEYENKRSHSKKVNNTILDVELSDETKNE
ncbi:hypothetical protein OBRU01_26065 [Operophtera brumata]|uniref:Uncharacterized protein n=1 Tax=Operophtera brumata TaxID=104452 RepID=A0A0L7K3W2_OPEBR|nr:hypothetical protein OBRU01_26065 [Operophtera brumata]